MTLADETAPTPESSRRPRCPAYVQARRRRDGTWSFRGWAMIDGRRVYSRPFDDPLEAHAEAQRLRSDAADGPHALLTLGSAIRMHEERLAALRRPGTLAWYRDRHAALLRVWPEELPLAMLTAADVDAFVRTRLDEVSAATVNHELVALNRLFALALRRGLVTSNPVDQVERPRVTTPRRHFFTMSELVAVLPRIRAADPIAADLVVALASSGLRRSEFLRLRPEHLALGDARLWVQGKVDNEFVAIAHDGVDAFRRLRDLLPMPAGRFTVHWRHARAAVDGDERLHPHAMRHTFITALARAGTPIAILQRVARLRTTALLQTYYHHGDEVSRALSALNLPGA